MLLLCYVCAIIVVMCDYRDIIRFMMCVICLLLCYYCVVMVAVCYFRVMIVLLS